MELKETLLMPKISKRKFVELNFKINGKKWIYIIN